MLRSERAPVVRSRRELLRLGVLGLGLVGLGAACAPAAPSPTAPPALPADTKPPDSDALQAAAGGEVPQWRAIQRPGGRLRHQAAQRPGPERTGPELRRHHRE